MSNDEFEKEKFNKRPKKKIELKSGLVMRSGLPHWKAITKK
jgi:hypothetical protein